MDNRINLYFNKSQTSAMKDLKYSAKYLNKSRNFIVALALTRFRKDLDNGIFDVLK